MRPAGMYSALTVSLFLHVMAVTAMFIVIKNSLDVKPTPYVVSLVYDSPSQVAPAPAEEKEAAVAPAPAPPKKESAKDKAKPSMKVKEDESAKVRDRIEALKAKQRIERLVNLRNTISISGKKSDTQARPAAPADKQAKGGAPAAGKGEYAGLIKGVITGNWIYPDTLPRDLEATLILRVEPDGKITVLDWKKKSENSLFNRSILSAVTKSSPLPKPPSGFEEIEMRFTP